MRARAERKQLRPPERMQPETNKPPNDFFVPAPTNRRYPLTHSEKESPKARTQATANIDRVKGNPHTACWQKREGRARKRNSGKHDHAIRNKGCD